MVLNYNIETKAWMNAENKEEQYTYPMKWVYICDMYDL